jgi:hypothetical protein
MNYLKYIKNIIVDKEHIIISITNSIHYNALITNNYNIYNNLIIFTNQKEHSVEIFKTLLNNFDITKINKIKVVFNKTIKKYVIIDGLHRLSIMLFTNIISINDDLTKFLKIIN